MYLVCTNQCQDKPSISTNHLQILEVKYLQKCSKKKVSAEVKTKMCNILGLHNVGEIGKYLGLHEHFRNKKSDMVTYITYKVKAITQGLR